ncbi:MAG: diguanylate cyclase [Gammaproteobacteria bacterium]|nr:MAG: diguanylate cyclase [Gammaproteobacteria bacterium]
MAPQTNVQPVSGHRAPLRRILVVDGSEVSRTVIRRTLEEALPDAEVLVCRSGGEALSLLDASPVDLVSTSLRLPDMDGLDLCRHLRRHKVSANVPVIVVSGDANARLLEGGFAAGVTDYFDKSLGYREFARFLRSFLARTAGLVGRILYVEDSATTAHHIMRVMKNHGLEVIHTQSAEQAFELLSLAQSAPESRKAPFDVVVTDFYLRGSMTGGDLLHAIRARLHLGQQELPVLVLTSAEEPERQIEVFHAGANDFVTKPVVEQILIARIRSLLTIRQQYAALRKQAEEMHHMAITDSLTGVHNKCHLLRQGERFLADRRNQPVSVLVIDLDRFKHLNDSYGHLVGDRILEALGGLLRECLREDTLAARFGGEEFVVLLPRCPLEEGCRRAEEIRQRIEHLYPEGIQVTASVGVACSEQHLHADLPSLLAMADKALYQAKQAGRNRVCA